MQKNGEDDFAMYVAMINKHCNEFKLADLGADNFKCLVFAQGLTSGRDVEIKRCVLTKLENEPNLTLQKLMEDCQKIEIIKKKKIDGYQS